MKVLWGKTIMTKIKVGFAITGSFCTHEKILLVLKDLVKKGYDILPILSYSVKNTDTRFGSAKDFYKNVKDITGKTPIDTIVGAEPVGPKGMIDILVVAPCTGNTLSKLANAITDTAPTMVAKAHLRNNKPLVIAVSSNDALGLNMKNLATLMSTKNVYFVPFGQDDATNKPKSLIADYDMIEETILCALKHEQIQPVLLK